jgi:hypothetical protein
MPLSSQLGFTSTTDYGPHTASSATVLRRTILRSRYVFEHLSVCHHSQPVSELHTQVRSGRQRSPPTFLRERTGWTTNRVSDPMRSLSHYPPSNRTTRISFSPPGCAIPTLHPALPPQNASYPRSHSSIDTRIARRAPCPYRYTRQSMSRSSTRETSRWTLRGCCSPLSCSTRKIQHSRANARSPAQLRRAPRYIIGRRGPLQAAFTNKELRELTSLDGAYASPLTFTRRKVHMPANPSYAAPAAVTTARYFKPSQQILAARLLPLADGPGTRALRAPKRARTDASTYSARRIRAHSPNRRDVRPAYRPHHFFHRPAGTEDEAHRPDHWNSPAHHLGTKALITGREEPRASAQSRYSTISCAVSGGTDNRSFFFFKKSDLYCVTSPRLSTVSTCLLTI